MDQSSHQDATPEQYIKETHRIVLNTNAEIFELRRDVRNMHGMIERLSTIVNSLVGLNEHSMPSEPHSKRRHNY